MNLQGREVTLSRAQKVLYPAVGVTKAELAQHYLRASHRMLPHLADRPLTLIRMPDGVGGPTFFQKNTPDYVPDWIPRCPVAGSDGTTHYTLVNEPPALVVLADHAVGEIHGWVATCRDPDRPDRVVFDFDPPTGERFRDVREGAKDLAGSLEHRGAAPHALLTGSRGIHLVVPLVAEATSDEVNAFADAVALAMTRHRPDRFTVDARKARRGDRVYVDVLRNRRKQTSILPWSPRIRPVAPVAAPITLDALDDDDLDPQRVTIRNAAEWLARPDPWRHFRERAVALTSLF